MHTVDHKIIRIRNGSPAQTSHSPKAIFSHLLQSCVGCLAHLQWDTKQMFKSEDEAQES